MHVDHVGYGAAPDGARLSIDAGIPIDGLDLRGVALYAPPEAVLRDDFGTMEKAIDAGAELVVVTRGAEGSVACAGDKETIEAPGVDVEVVSTLGAGDSSTARCSRASSRPTAPRGARARERLRGALLPRARRTIRDSDLERARGSRPMSRHTAADWWHDAVFYEIYVRSFADSNGDGVGDLPASARAWRTCASSASTAIWLTPFYPSPGADHGYDVSNYVDVDPLSGRSTTSTTCCATRTRSGCAS